MAAEKIYVFWGLLLVLVPLAASRMGKSWTRVDQWFTAACVLATFILVRFVPRPELSAVAAIAATLVASAVVVAAYLAASPPARARASRLAILVGLMDVAALAAIGLGDRLRLDWPLSSLLLLLFAAIPLAAAGWLGRGPRRP